MHEVFFLGVWTFYSVRHTLSWHFPVAFFVIWAQYVNSAWSNAIEMEIETLKIGRYVIIYAETVPEYFNGSLSVPLFLSFLTLSWSNTILHFTSFSRLSIEKSFSTMRLKVTCDKQKCVKNMVRTGESIIKFQPDRIQLVLSYAIEFCIERFKVSRTFDALTRMRNVLQCSFHFGLRLYRAKFRGLAIIHFFFQLSPKKIKYSKDTIKWAICEMNCLDGIVYDTISINTLCRLEWHWKFKLNSSLCSCTNHFTLSTSNVKKKEKRNFAMWFKRDDVLNVTTINANRII